MAVSPFPEPVGDSRGCCAAERCCTPPNHFRFDPAALVPASGRGFGDRAERSAAVSLGALAILHGRPVHRNRTPGIGMGAGVKSGAKWRAMHSLPIIYDADQRACFPDLP